MESREEQDVLQAKLGAKGLVNSLLGQKGG